MSDWQGKAMIVLGFDRKLHMLRCCLHVRSVCSEFFSCNFDIDVNGKSPKLWRTLRAGSPIFHRSQSGKVFWVQVLTKSRSEHLSSPLSQKENSLCQELLWCKCCFETWPAQKVPRIEFSKRNSQDLFCSGIGCQLTLNALQKILTGIKIITIFILQMKCNCTWPPRSDHLKILSCGRLKSRIATFNFCQKKMVSHLFDLLETTRAWW